MAREKKIDLILSSHKHFYSHNRITRDIKANVVEFYRMRRINFFFVNPYADILFKDTTFWNLKLNFHSILMSSICSVYLVIPQFQKKQKIFTLEFYSM